MADRTPLSQAALEERRAREAAALRENLLKRKDQARQREAAANADRSGKVQEK